MLTITKLNLPGIAEASIQEDWTRDVDAVLAIFDAHFPEIPGVALTPPSDPAALRAQLRQRAPRLRRLADSLLCALRGGLSALTIPTLGIADESTDTQRKLLYALSALMGMPSAAEPRERRVVWDVKPTQQSGEYFPTFSEHDGEALYHTDTQYYARPERYFLLYIVAPARCGGGELMMRHGEALKEELLKTEAGREAVRVLTQALLPFRVPSVFTSTGGGGDKEFTHAAVFGDEVFLRWRGDTIRKGLADNPAMATHEVCSAIECVESLLRSAPGEHRARLPKDSLCLVDNHVVLHGRTSFSDRERHLIRIRFHDTLGHAAP